MKKYKKQSLNSIFYILIINKSRINVNLYNKAQNYFEKPVETLIQ